MEELSWTGSFGSNLIPALVITAAVFLAGVVLQLIMGFFAPEEKLQANADGTLQSRGGLLGGLEKLNGQIFMLIVFILAAIVVISWFMPYGKAGILGEVIKRFLPVWIALIVTFALSITFKRKLGLYGKLFDSTIGMIGFALVMFWVFTSIFVGVFDMIATHDPLQQISGLKNKTPGIAVPEGQDADFFPHYLLGGDNLARDIFSRMVHGSVIVMIIAPLATVFAFMVGITLGLPAGYYGGVAVEPKSLIFWVITLVFAVLAILAVVTFGFGPGLMAVVALAILLALLTHSKLDTILSFLANLILAFPVILLFYLLVTPEIVETGLPNYMAAFLFIFPLIFFGVLINSRYKTQGSKNTLYLAVVLIPLAFIYLSAISEPNSPLQIWPAALDLFSINSGILVVFVSVVFVNSPTVFRIVRGLALDIKTRDYVAAAQTRGEGTWYIMLWEILPNARGPLIVDFCLRIGYTTILLGTLGFFGLGLPPESPDWGSTINEGRKLLLIFAHPALPPAMALLSLVLGLNLLADGLREESLKD
ncbi:peptide/nickel transport system permease protein [Octadecabacter temperatus]|uniref:Glutathione transport system permease protein GsiD n=1 Tax=Octadecabacter temperatus TaxID=1458307 RepID=A0A0K0Y4R8_9RHOB|nr:ABC transporter permease [Octadecabacter temperatus]AKS45930.1 Glutathione transport system permease protein GsiD [Octadecabacter temperatus]SIO03748.1 peptide/nickel transport system permease protein [Octadecabacter temperatus]